MAQAALPLVPSPHWALFTQDEFLLVTGGADETYVVDEAVLPTERTALLQAWTQGQVEESMAPAAVRQLRRLGALIPHAAAAPAQTWSVRWLDEPDADLAAALQADLPGLAWTPDAEDADVHLVVRRTGDWQQALRAYAAHALRRPHLFLDLSHHHTLCIGPYVVPGETACIACLGARIRHRWGDPPVPPRPLAGADAGLAAGLVRQRLSRGRVSYAAPPHAGWIALLETCVTLNLDTLVTDRARVFRLPWCPVCGDASGGTGDGSVALPWVAPR